MLARMIINYINMYTSMEDAIDTITTSGPEEAENISEIQTIQVGKYMVSRCQFEMYKMTQTCFKLKIYQHHFMELYSSNAS